MKNLSKKIFVLLGLILVNFNTFSQAPSAGLIAYYPFTGNVNDASGNGRNGGIGGGVTLTKDRYGNADQAYYFNGVDGAISANWNQLTGNSARTMSVWFKTTTPTTSQYMVSWGVSTLNNSSIIGTHINIGMSTKYLGFFAYSVSSSALTDALQFYDDRWHLMTYTFDGTTSNLFLDGVLQMTQTNVTLNTTSTQLTIGAYTTGPLFFAGSLDEVRIYNRALTTTEVQQMYAGEVAPSTTTDVIKVGVNKIFHITGVDNTYLGSKSGAFSSGVANTFLGVNTGSFNTGSFNCFYGVISGAINTSGQNNVFMGWASGNENTNGSDNTFIGTQAGGLNKGGAYNTNIGKLAGYNNLNGSNNTFIGAGANTFGVNKASLFSSSAIGTNARVSINNAIVLGDFENNDLKVGIGIHDPQFALDVKGSINLRKIGSLPSELKFGSINFLKIDEKENAGVGLYATVDPTASHSMAIGYKAFASADNVLALGGTKENAVNVGIGNSAPKNRLEITTNIEGESGLTFTNLTKDAMALNSNSKFLSVDKKGKVGLYNLSADQITLKVDNRNKWPDYVFTKDFKLLSLSELEHYIKINSHLPNIPSAEEMVEKGIPVETMISKLLKNQEEMTLHMIEMKKEIEQLKKDNLRLRRKNKF